MKYNLEKTRMFILFIIFILFSATIVHTQEEKKTTSYTGIMNFLRAAKEVTIVAPTLNEKKIEAGMLSCERKKNYIERFFGSKVKIVADKDLTEADKKGNFIIVGKENALLKEIWQKTPIRPTPDSFFFDVQEYANPRDHITFTQVNPFNEFKLILICTSIDPDIDKIRPIPQYGSDWMIMRDLSIIRQGRFYGGTSLPPGSDPLAEMDRSAEVEGFYKNLVKAESQFYEIYHPSDLDEKDKIPDGVKKRDAALLSILKRIGVKAPDKKFKIFIYKDKEQKAKISDVAEPIHFFDGRKEVHMISKYLFADSIHDDSHVVAGFILSDSASVQMTEGFAVSIDAQWKGEPLPYWSGFYLKADKLPSLYDLLDEEKYIRFPSEYSFPLVGSLATMIIEKNGIDPFRKLLGQLRVTDASSKEILGMDLGKLDSEWKSDIKAKAGAYSKKIDFAVCNDAARKNIEKKDFSAAVKEFLKALAVIPDDPQALFNLASAYIRVPDLESAEKTFLKLASMELPDSDRRFIVFSHYQLGRLYDLRGDREKAISEYNKVLSLPDMFDSHKLAKDRMDRPASQYDFE